MLRKFDIDIKSDLFVAISMIRVMVYSISLLEICSVIGGKLRVRDWIEFPIWIPRSKVVANGFRVKAR